MFNFFKKQPADESLEKITRTLSRIIELLKQSEGSPWVSITPQDIIEQLSQTLEVINESNIERELEKIRLLFAPTGSLQDISIDNGWGEEFIKLASVFD